MVHLFFALLAVAALVLAACVLWPLRATAPRLFAALVLCMPVLLLALYQITGTPAGLVAGTARAPQDGMPHSLDDAIAQLEAELQHNPNEPEGWALLARSHAAQGNLTRARDAWTRALALAPDEPILLTEAAQAQAQADPQNWFDDDSVAWLERAIALQPDNQRARWFIGVAQRQRGEDAKAAATWEALLPLVDAGTAASLREQIDEARRTAGLPPSTPAASAPTPAASETAAAARALTVTVLLSPALASRTGLNPGASVFVLARQPGGPPMPVAVTRLRLADLPATVTLDDSNSPMPTQPLSALDEVEVLARLSASGSAVRQDGDIDSAPVRLRLPHPETIVLVIGDAR